MPDLGRSIVSALENVVGRTLTKITVRALDGELRSRDELSLPDLFIGGEVRLRFDGGLDLFVSWVENDGWSHHFSLGGRDASHFTPESLHEWDTSDLEPWSQCTGTSLSSARILGSDGTPHIVELAFENASLWLGDGHQHEFGDGDDLLIRWAGAHPNPSDWEELWSSRTERGLRDAP